MNKYYLILKKKKEKRKIKTYINIEKYNNKFKLTLFSIIIT